MVCIYCNSPTRVSNSRLQKRANTVWRRRKCQACKALFTTEEATLLAPVIAVLSPDGSIHGFSREKLLISLYSSLKHRHTALSDAIALTDTVTSTLLPKAQAASIHTTTIIQVVAETLDRFDQAAAVQYRAYHPLTS